MRVRASLIEKQSCRSEVDLPPVENPIRIGVVGLGHRSVGNFIPKVICYEDYQLVAICDLRTEVVKKVGADLEKKHGLKVAAYHRYDEMLRNEKLDAVVGVGSKSRLACQAILGDEDVTVEVLSFV